MPSLVTPRSWLAQLNHSRKEDGAPFCTKNFATASPEIQQSFYDDFYSFFSSLMHAPHVLAVHFCTSSSLPQNTHQRFNFFSIGGHRTKRLKAVMYLCLELRLSSIGITILSASTKPLLFPSFHLKLLPQLVLSVLISEIKSLMIFAMLGKTTLRFIPSSNAQSARVVFDRSSTTGFVSNRLFANDSANNETSSKIPFTLLSVCIRRATATINMSNIIATVSK